MRWIKEEGKQTGREKEEENGYREREERKKKGRFCRSFDGWSSTTREEKLIHASQATREY